MNVNPLEPMPVLLLLILFSVPLAAAEPLVGASVTGDAEGRFAAVSVGGTARSTNTAVSVLGAAESPGGIAAAGTGPARGWTPVSLLGTCNGFPCIAIAPAGPTRAYWVAVGGESADAHLLAASVREDATCRPFTHSRECVAASVNGMASCEGPVGSRCWTASLTGDAESPYGTAISGSGHAVGAIAASGTGNASAGCGITVSIAGDAEGCRPLSVAGTCDGRPCIAVARSGDALGWWAGVGAGRAEGGLLAASLYGPAGGGPSGGTGVAISVFGPARGHVAGVGIAESFCATGTACLEP